MYISSNMRCTSRAGEGIGVGVLSRSLAADKYLLLVCQSSGKEISASPFGQFQSFAQFGHGGGEVAHGEVRPPFGYPRIIACLQLPEAFRSLPRPSSPVGTKAFTVRPYLLHHIAKAVTTSTIPQSPFVTYCIVSLLGMHVYLVFCSCCSTTHFVGKRLLLSNRFLCHADVNFRFPSIIDFAGGPDRT